MSKLEKKIKTRGENSKSQHTHTYVKMSERKRGSLRVVDQVFEISLLGSSKCYQRPFSRASLRTLGIN